MKKQKSKACQRSSTGGNDMVYWGEILIAWPGFKFAMSTSFQFTISEKGKKMQLFSIFSFQGGKYYLTSIVYIRRKCAKIRMLFFSLKPRMKAVTKALSPKGEYRLQVVHVFLQEMLAKFNFSYFAAVPIGTLS